MAIHIRRREFIFTLGGAAAAWPLAARAQQPAMPVVGFVNAGSPDAPLAAAFRKGLNEAGYVEGQNVTVEYHWLEGQFDRLPALMADLVRRRVAVIATPAGNHAALAAKAATTTIPIVFGVGEDPVKLGLVASLARPGGNLTGINFFASEMTAKRLALLHELVPKAVRIAVLVNPANIPATESHATRPTGRRPCNRTANSGPQRQHQRARSRRPSPPSCVTAPMPCTSAATCSSRAGASNLRRSRRAIAIPATYPSREAVEAGGLMGYDTDRVDMYRQVGTYTGQILKGAKPADLPVVAVDQIRVRHQPTNRQGARPRNAADAARPRRRGDRIEKPFAAVHQSVPGTFLPCQPRRAMSGFRDKAAVPQKSRDGRV